MILRFLYSATLHSFPGAFLFLVAACAAVAAVNNAFIFTKRWKIEKAAEIQRGNDENMSDGAVA